MKKWKVAGWILLGILVVIQFFQPTKNEASGTPSRHISAKYPIPENVAGILQRACNDCHSNNTVYPWYSHVQPVAWWLDKHVRDGKRHLNFDEFMGYPAARQYHKLEETVEMVEDDEMPLSSYTFIHANARLTAEEKKQVTDWCRSVRSTMQATYPPDSLVRKKR
ncbi:heme-binding domain-containing protein [Chitinophaga lutea]